jgi:hypothetical protein
MKINPLLKRMGWILAVVAIQFIYFPTSQATSGGIAPRLPIDVIPVYLGGAILSLLSALVVWDHLGAHQAR